MCWLTVSATACTMSLGNMLSVTAWRENLIAAMTLDPRGVHGRRERKVLALSRTRDRFKSAGWVFEIKALHTLCWSAYTFLSLLVALHISHPLFLFNPYQLSMAPRTRACQAHKLNHTARESNDTSFDESTHASTVDKAGVEKESIINLTNSQKNANGTSNTTISEIYHSLITPRKTHLFHP